MKVEKINNRIKNLRKASEKICVIKAPLHPMNDMVVYDRCIDSLIAIHTEILVLEWVLNLN